MTVETELQSRIPAGASVGRTQVITKTLAAVAELKGKVAEKDQARTPFGRATDVLAPFLKHNAAPNLLKARRQLAHGQRMLDQQRAALEKKAKGEPKATDHLWLERVWKMSPGERAAFVLKNAAARGPALREPELAGIEGDVFKHAMRATIRESFEREGAFLDVAQEAQDLHRLAIDEFEKAIVAAPAIGDPATGQVRSFHGKTELTSWIDRELPGDATKAPSLFETTEIEL